MIQETPMNEEERAALNPEGSGEPSNLIRPLEMDLGKNNVVLSWVLLMTVIVSLNELNLTH